MRAHWAQHQDETALETAELAVDLDAASATCPACGAEFVPSAGRCSSCGLRLG